MILLAIHHFAQLETKEETMNRKEGEGLLKINLDAQLSWDHLWKVELKTKLFLISMEQGNWWLQGGKEKHSSTVFPNDQQTWDLLAGKIQSGSKFRSIVNSCSRWHINCQHLSPLPFQGIGEQDSPPDLPDLHPGLLDLRLNLANRWQPHPRWQCLKLYFTCVRILRCLF